MIGRLRGLVVERNVDGTCVIDVAGVGYEVFVPQSTQPRLPAPPEEVTLHVHTHVREDALSLFGFATSLDRAAFRALLGVSGVGPKIALALLSALDGRSLALAVASGDKARFSGIAGVGKKTVERLVLELKDKMPLLVGTSSIGVPAPGPTGIAGSLGRVVGALVQLGYKQGEAERAVARLRDPEGKTVDVLLREALGALS